MTVLAPLLALALAGSADLTTCSGSVVRFRDQSADSLALVLTNGHCLHRLPPGESVSHAPSGRRLTLFDARGAAVRKTFEPREIVYGTMTDVDVAVYQLRATYRELTDRWKVPSLVIDEGPAAAQGAVLVASGRFRKALRCRWLGQATVREGAWTFPGALRLEGCAIEHGMSGSPIVSERTGEVVGVLNTFAFAGAAPCGEDGPCEVDASGATSFHAGRAYGSPLGALRGLLDANADGPPRSLSLGAAEAARVPVF